MAAPSSLRNEGQIYRYRIAPGGSRSDDIETGDKPFITAWGTNSNPAWSPDGTQARVRQQPRRSPLRRRLRRRRSASISYMSPSVDLDTSPTWSPDGKQIAFIRRPGTPFGRQAQAGCRRRGQSAGTCGRTRPRHRAAARVVAGQGRGGRGSEDEGPQSPIPGLTRATFKGGYTLSFWVADVATGEAREVWHNKPNDQTFHASTRSSGRGDSLDLPGRARGVDRYYSVQRGRRQRPIRIVLTPGDGMVENDLALERRHDAVTTATNAGDIDRRAHLEGADGRRHADADHEGRRRSRHTRRRWRRASMRRHADALTPGGRSLSA